MEKFNAELSEMNLEEVKQRKADLEQEIRNAKDKESLSGMEEKVRLVNERIAELEDLEKRKAAVVALQNGTADGVKVVETRKEERSMEMTREEKIKEIRNSAKYIDAYAEYVKTGKAEEVRALLSENAEDGTIAVPDFVYDIVKTAWDKNEIMSLVETAEIAGNLKVQFEISGDDAQIHTEGGEAVTEEELTEGIATLVPAYIKKWISISDEVMSLRGSAFLNYIYRELAYKIAKKAADQLIAMIAALPAVATATSPNAAKITSAPAVGTVAAAIGNLSDEAANPVIVMNKLTWSVFKAAQYANNYGVDPFEGLRVLYNNTLPAYNAASANAVYMIVGDFGHGALANFPNGQNIEYKFDDLTRKKEDLVEVLGKEYVGLGVTACKSFALVAKPSQG